MPVTTKLVISYVDRNSGEDRSISYSGVNSALNTATVRNICSVLETNGRIFKYGIRTVTGAKLVTETVSEYEL